MPWGNALRQPCVVNTAARAESPSRWESTGLEARKISEPKKLHLRCCERSQGSSGPHATHLTLPVGCATPKRTRADPSARSPRSGACWRRSRTNGTMRCPALNGRGKPTTKHLRRQFEGNCHASQLSWPQTVRPYVLRSLAPKCRQRRLTLRVAIWQMRRAAMRRCRGVCHFASGEAVHARW